MLLTVYKNLNLIFCMRDNFVENSSKLVIDWISILRCKLKKNCFKTEYFYLVFIINHTVQKGLD